MNIYSTTNDNTIFCSCDGTGNEIYYISYYGLGCLNLAKKTFTNINYDLYNGLYYPNTLLNSNNNLIYFSSNNLITMYDITYKTKININVSDIGNKLMKLSKYKFVYIGNNTSYLFINGVRTNILCGNKYFNIDNNKNIWYASSSNELNYYNYKKEKNYKIKLGNSTINYDIGITSNNNVWSLIYLNNNIYANSVARVVLKEDNKYDVKYFNFGGSLPSGNEYRYKIFTSNECDNIWIYLNIDSERGYIYKFNGTLFELIYSNTKMTDLFGKVINHKLYVYVYLNYDDNLSVNELNINRNILKINNNIKTYNVLVDEIYYDGPKLHPEIDEFINFNNKLYFVTSYKFYPPGTNVNRNAINELIL